MGFSRQEYWSGVPLSSPKIHTTIYKIDSQQRPALPAQETIFNIWEYQTIWPASGEICMQVKKQQLELDMEQQTGSKSWKDNVKAVYCHPAYLTYIQRTSWEIAGWMRHKLESRFLEEISITSDTQMIPPLWQKAKKNKKLLDRSERGEWKSWLKAQHSEN